MNSRYDIALGFLAAAGFLTSPLTHAASDYPNKPVRIIVPSAAGGTQDIVTRLVAQKMAEVLGQSIVVDNRPGGDTLIGTRYVKDAPADGYTILSQANGFTTLPQLNSSAGYDPLKDFTGVGMMTRSPYLMVVSADSPDRTVKDFVSRAKSNKLTFASGGIGGPPHTAATLFMKNQHIEMTNILYKGNSLSYADIVANRVSTIFGGYNGVLPYLQTGKLRALAVSSPKRIAPLPQIPTFVEQGIDYRYTLWLGLLVRSDTPKEVVSKLSEALRHALASKELKDRFASEGADSTFMTPAEFNTFVSKDVAEMKAVAHELNSTK
ncbi:Bug family tripartite tricarboxylate transporter substrate binding protein [Cupriavidus metallidurans]|uniref:Bug family tripartite tricarboxylate transporter substrate binding protein n=1 Tax=Cupriavidus metallidurans TaxID=119219 RepID=UPI00056CB8AA|nr:tripartite tricarboxylate transporter substrate binding protein [Cupriavidus metallidurans]